MVRLVSSVRFRQGAPRRRSSVGQSTRLIIVGSPVRVRPPLPEDARRRVGPRAKSRGEEREASEGHPRLRGLQASQLHHDQEQAERPRADRDEEVLPLRSAAHRCTRRPAEPTQARTTSPSVVDELARARDAGTAQPSSSLVVATSADRLCPRAPSGRQRGRRRGRGPGDLSAGVPLVCANSAATPSFRPGSTASPRTARRRSSPNAGARRTLELTTISPFSTRARSAIPRRPPERARRPGALVERLAALPTSCAWWSCSATSTTSRTRRSPASSASARRPPRSDSTGLDAVCASAVPACGRGHRRGATPAAGGSRGPCCSPAEARSGSRTIVPRRSEGRTRPWAPGAEPVAGSVPAPSRRHAAHGPRRLVGGPEQVVDHVETCLALPGGACQLPQAAAPPQPAASAPGRARRAGVSRSARCAREAAAARVIRSALTGRRLVATAGVAWPPRPAAVVAVTVARRGPPRGGFGPSVLS